MWPAQHWTPGEGAHNKNPLRQDSNADRLEENPGIQAPPSSILGSVLQAPSNSTDDSIDFSELMTKPETIIESPGAQDWDLGFAELSNLQSAKSHNPSNRFQSDTKPTASTSLHSSNLIPPSSDSGSDKSQPAHLRFYGLFFLAGFQKSRI